MAKNILFISRYPDITQEFLDAMKDKDFVVDAVSNGNEAVNMLSRTEYQVVVTGLTMDGYNGEQLITHINKEHPNTICIIYTTNISPTQLNFFMNKRDVFRVFLRPVDFRNEFFLALEDAFLYYEVRVKNQEEEQQRKQDFARGQEGAELLKKKLALQKINRSRMLVYIKRLLQFSVNGHTGRLSPEARNQLGGLEWQVAELCLSENGQREENLRKAEAAVQRIKKIKVP